MKKLLLTFIVAVWAMLPLFAQEVPATLEEVKAKLYGTWNWQYTLTGMLLTQLTPATYGPGTLTFAPAPEGEPENHIAFNLNMLYDNEGVTAIIGTPDGWGLQIKNNTWQWRIMLLTDTELRFFDSEAAVDGDVEHYFTRSPMLTDCNQLTPTITGDLLVNCPYSASTLSTQPYSSYQWFKRGYFETQAQPIPGATEQTYTATIDDVLYYFSVQVTQDTCIATSPEVLIDQMVTLPPFVSSEGNFTVDASGNTIVCPGDTLWFTAFSIANIQWYNNGIPVGELNQNPFPVTQSGYYTVMGNDPICTLYPAALGLEIPVIAPDKPTIAQTEPTIVQVINPDNFTSFAWYKDGILQPDVLNSVYSVTSGNSFTLWVQTTDVYGCTAQSNPISITGTGAPQPDILVIGLHPNPASNEVYFTGLPATQNVVASWYAISGMLLLQTPVQPHTPVNISALPAGMYICLLTHNNGVLLSRHKVAVVR